MAIAVSTLEFKLEPETTLDDIVKIRESGSVPGDAKVSIRVAKKDYPWQPDAVYFKLRWEEEYDGR